MTNGSASWWEGFDSELEALAYFRRACLEDTDADEVSTTTVAQAETALAMSKVVGRLAAINETLASLPQDIARAAKAEETLTIDGRAGTDYDERFLATLPVGTTLTDRDGHEFTKLPDHTWWALREEVTYDDGELACLTPLTAAYIPNAPCKRPHLTKALVREMARLIATHSNTFAAWSDWKALIGPGISHYAPKETA